jgi:hypothetical protein
MGPPQDISTVVGLLELTAHVRYGSLSDNIHSLVPCRAVPPITKLLLKGYWRVTTASVLPRNWIIPKPSSGSAIVAKEISTWGSWMLSIAK